MTKLCALLILLLLTGCVNAHPAPDIRQFALRLDFGGGVVCSGTVKSASEIRTATHCFGEGPLLSINGVPAGDYRVTEDGRDHAVVTLAAPRFNAWPKDGKPLKAGDRVRWWGQPQGRPFVYREGVVSMIGDGYLLIDATICHGDSGAGLMNDAGEYVGSITGMTNESGCTFMGVML